MSRSVVVVACLTCTATISTAAPRAIRGIVVDEASGLPVAGASIFTERGDIVVADADGYFTITVDRDRELTVVANRYATKVVRVATELRIELTAVAGAEVIEVVGKRPEETKPLSYKLTADEIRTIPGAGNDILRAAQVLPGVARIPYSFGGLVLRGTSPRDTATYLDGVEVPLAFHFGGITSFYPSGMLADLTLTAGGFDASFGRAQGGLVDIKTREPRTDRWRMGGAIGLLEAGVQAEGPIGPGGIIVGIRRNYFDVIVDPFVSDATPLPSYWDFQIRTSFGDPRVGGRITPMLFGSIDSLASNAIGITSRFVRVAAPFLRQWGSLSLKLVPWLGANSLEFSDESDDEGSAFSRPVYPGGIRAELSRDYTWGHLRGGLEANGGYLSHTRLSVTGGPQLEGDTDISWLDLATWGELRIKLDGERFAIKPGVRLEHYGLSQEGVIDPRLNIHQKLTSYLTLRQAIGRYHQSPTPADVDPIDGNKRLDASFNDQVSLGLDLEVDDLFASVTGFYTQGDRIQVEVERPSPTNPGIPDPELGGLGPTFKLLLEKQLGFPIYRENRGRARSYGVEVLVKRNVGRVFGMISYTLSRAERTEDPRARLGWRPFELDQTHNLNLAASIQLGNWRLGARLQAVSGVPYSPIGIIKGEVRQIPWAANLPTFFALDLRVDRRWHRCWGDINFYIDIQNATNRGNVEGREADVDDFTETDVPGLPFIPFIGVEFLPLK